MRSINDLRAELSETEGKLKQITVSSYTKPVYDYERGEVRGESQELKQYTDNELARQLQARIEYLRNQINNYAIYAQAERENAALHQKMEKEAEIQKIQSGARELYEKAQSEYHSKGLIGKVGALFSGKKPKKNMSDKEIQQTYGEEAEVQFHRANIEAQIQKLEEEKAAILDWDKRNGSKFYDYHEYQYTQQIEQLRSQLNELDNKRNVR